MNENAKKWVAALRSGRYQQIDGQLSNGEKYCCLGVACEVAIENGVDVPKVQMDDEDKHVEYDGEEGCLPDVVQEWLGLQDDTGTHDDAETDSHPSLADLNDDGVSFDKIADIIESEPPMLFVPTWGTAAVQGGK